MDPTNGVTFGSDGALYGTTQDGGPNGSRSGLVYRLAKIPGTTRWRQTVIHPFSGTGADGHRPSELTLGKGGKLYGTNAVNGSRGVGTIFELTPPAGGNLAAPWIFKVIHNFTGTGGSGPLTGVIRDKIGVLYGTAFFGGARNAGVVYSLTPPAPGATKWTYRVLRHFVGTTNGAKDGKAPIGRLIMDRDGALYGTTREGGNGFGTIFKLIPPVSAGGKWTQKVLYRFASNDPNGCFPTSGLVAALGILYGTTPNCGANNGGTIYRVSNADFAKAAGNDD
jgi:uncharacterized repeat protein (TIGR03803 family)